MEEWKEYNLGDICTIVGRIGFRGYTTDDLTNSPNDGAITLSPTNIVAGELDLSKPTYIKWPKYFESPEIMLEQDDIVLVKTGSSIGRTTRIREVKHPMTLNPQFVVLKDIKVDNVFLSYVIKSPYFQALLRAITVGSAIPTLSQKNLAKLTVHVPDINTQKEIASILSSLDDKIELNRRINDNLEQQAQALFKSWFVDFEPFRDQPFVESELGMIPEGWRVGTLNELGDIVGGSTPSKAKPEYYTNNGIAWLTPKDLSISQRKFTSKGEIDITQEGYDSCSTKLMPKGTVLFSSRAPIGYITIAKNDICTNQGFKSVIPTLAGTAFLYCFLKESTQEIENKATGSTFKEASGALMKSLPVIIPEKAVLDDFESLLSPLFYQQEVVEEENSLLSSLRDTLLPRLMSGEIKVGDVTL